MRAALSLGLSSSLALLACGLLTLPLSARALAFFGGLAFACGLLLAFALDDLRSVHPGALVVFSRSDGGGYEALPRSERPERLHRERGLDPSDISEKTRRRDDGSRRASRKKPKKQYYN